MISFDIRFRNPWPARPFRTIWHRAWNLDTYKSFELQISRYAFNWLELQIDLNWRQTDHAGPWIMVNVFGWTVDARIYDIRHWDDITNTWKTYGTDEN